MGSWGTGIFADDTAADVRDRYVESLGDGLPGPEATQRVLEEWKDVLNDPDDGPVVWLALAATQWKHGRLQDDVKAKALEIIQNGVGLAVWEEQGKTLLRQRKAALEKLRAQLESPQPPLKKVPKSFKEPLGLVVGDAISYRLKSGKYVIFRIPYVFSPSKHRGHVYELCDWVGDELPDAEQIRLLPTKIRSDDGFAEHTFIECKRQEDYPADRIRLVARGVTRKHAGTLGYVLWKKVDEWLEREYGWS